jgi:homoserine acetyltransferase
MHGSTFDYLKPTDDQVATMQRVREAAKLFAEVLATELPDGHDKTFVIRNHRTTAMWANIAITRQPDGSPR